MSGNTIRDFMVALGFNIDNAGAKRMGDTLQGVENKAKSLNTVLLGLATGAVIAVTKTASELDKLYYSSQRIGASASNIRGFEAAISQMGGTAGNALQTLESLAQKIRQSPGYEGMVNNLGVSTRDQNGAMRDRVEVMKDMSVAFGKMQGYQANAYASALGIDENTLLAMRDPAFVQNLEKYQKIQKDMGMSDGLAKSGKDFMVEFRDVTMTIKAISEVILMTAGKALIPVLKIINTGLQNAIQWFHGLNPATKEFLTIGLKIGMLTIVIGGLVAAGSKLIGMIGILKSVVGLFKLLRIAILGSPIGLILALAAAIGLLYDDYMTWKNGSESLIDWGKWSYGIEGAIKGMKEIMEWLKKIGQAAVDFGAGAFDKVAKSGVGQAVANVANNVAAATTAVAQDVWNQFEIKGGKPFKTAMTEFKGGTIAGLTPVETLAFANRVMFRENKAGTLSTVNWAGYTGKYQFGAEALAETGFIDRGKLPKDRFVNKWSAKKKRNVFNPEAHKAFLADKRNWLKGDWEQYKSSAQLQDESFRLLVEANIKAGKDIHGGDKRKMMGYAMAAHLKGAGNAAKWYKKGKDSKDGNGTNTSDYAKFGEGFMEWIPGAEQKIAPINPPYKAPVINNVAPPTANPHKDQINAASSSNSKIINIYQNHKTDMVVNGAENPQLTASRVQQYNENTAIQMARNARSIMG